MKSTLCACLILFTLWLPAAAVSSEGKSMNTTSPLNQQQQSIITIAAFTASGDLDKLKPALVTGLDAGLTVNEIKEVLVQMYAYCGFPRSLNGLGTFMTLLDARKAQGIKDVIGKEATPVGDDFDRAQYGAQVRARLAGLEQDISGAKWQLFSPVMDQFLKEHLFADIFDRDVLTYAERELVTVSVISAIGNAEPMLRSHLTICLNVGYSPEQLQEFVGIIKSTIGKKAAKNAQAVLNGVVENQE